jgi:hypothetical protein
VHSFRGGDERVPVSFIGLDIVNGERVVDGEIWCGVGTGLVGRRKEGTLCECRKEVYETSTLAANLVVCSLTFTFTFAAYQSQKNTSFFSLVSV